MATIHKNLLLVEGEQDKRVIPYLIEANGIDWGTTRNPIVQIEAYDGWQQLINKDEISTALKSSGLEALGIMVDADDNPAGRWQSIRTNCLEIIPDLPDELPESGLIHPLPDDKKLGVWIMPDNKMQGMLETFLSYLIPEESEFLWEYAQSVVQQAKTKGAPLIESHIDKANIYTWLAWQHPPGRQLHNAIMERILNPTHPRSTVFINWFKNLYNL
ncbi:hypothetical protein NG796_10425 [Laspinema sp. A4]|uniref:DUF3226 domain-containing protein n=1 Tax=Laspinema sp. D2d TaxID=2953686 RepID=UPI0021BB586D|nr:DUF3226 domain-containing protein [Laspinema sp. D2d]MCT7983712.1 hypothetical protein [Laspinema sp. D2d]